MKQIMFPNFFIFENWTHWTSLIVLSIMKMEVNSAENHLRKNWTRKKLGEKHSESIGEEI